MNETARCRDCGIRYDPHRDRCPRCGRSQGPSGTRTGARRSFRLATPAGLAAAGTTLGLVVALGACVMWARAARTGVEARGPEVSAPLARLFQKEAPRRPAGLVRVQNDLPFLEAAEETEAVARHEYAAGDYEAALAHFRALLENDPDDADARSNAGQILVRLGRVEEALPLLQEAVDRDPSRWAYRFNLARAHGLLGRWSNAVEDYTKAARLFPGDYATLFNLAQALHRAGREAEAVAQYRLAIDQKRDDPTFYLALGISEEKLGHAAEAAAAYRRYAEMDPSATQAAAATARAQQLEARAAAAPAAAPAGNAESGTSGH